MPKTNRSAYRIIVTFLLLICLFGCDKCRDKWSVTEIGQILEIGYGGGGIYPQFAALHLNDGYFRMIPATDSGWGTSVIIVPSFWSGGMLFQGTPVSYTSEMVDSGLRLTLAGTISTLSVTAEIWLYPPLGSSFSADISVSVGGDVVLDNRPGEAFKLVMLSSMHNSPTIWDCSSAFAGSQTFEIPPDGWMIQPPVLTSIFGLEGGTSSWKTNAPTIEVRLDRNVSVSGWITPSSDPNNDNVGFWGASDELIRSWSYRLISRR